MRIPLASEMSLSEICRVLGIGEVTEDKKIYAITTDTRLAARGDLFIALGGGVEFIPEARRIGCITLGDADGADVRYSGEAALLKIAEHYRSFHLPCLRSVIAITGSVGKTTAKELATRLIAPHRRVHATEGNQNNTVGVPFTILSAPRDVQVLIVEMGMNARGEIGVLSRVARPTVAVITNVGTAHIGKLGSREEIAAAKCEVREGLSGKLYAPLGEPLLDGCADARFTVGGVGDFCALTLTRHGDTVEVYALGKYRGCGKFPYGEHHTECLAAALAVATDAVGDEVIGEIEKIAPDAMRERIYDFGDFKIIDDSYNASFESVMAAFEYMSQRYHGVRCAVLGDILELGELAPLIHEKIGSRAAECITGDLWLVGDFAPFVAKGAVRGGLMPERIHIMSSVEECAAACLRLCGGEAVLVKGSHRTRLWELVKILKGARKKQI